MLTTDTIGWGLMRWSKSLERLFLRGNSGKPSFILVGSLDRLIAHRFAASCAAVGAYFLCCFLFLITLESGLLIRLGRNVPDVLCASVGHLLELELVCRARCNAIGYLGGGL